MRPICRFQDCLALGMAARRDFVMRYPHVLAPNPSSGTRQPLASEHPLDTRRHRYRTILEMVFIARDLGDLEEDEAAPSGANWRAPSPPRQSFATSRANLLASPRSLLVGWSLLRKRNLPLQKKLPATSAPFAATASSRAPTSFPLPSPEVPKRATFLPSKLFLSMNRLSPQPRKGPYSPAPRKTKESSANLSFAFTSSAATSNSVAMASATFLVFPVKE